MVLPAEERPPKDFRELEWQQAQGAAAWKSKLGCDNVGINPKTGTKTITLPYYSVGSDNMSRYVEVDTDTGHGAALGFMKVKKANPIIPGWLIELKEFYLRGVMDLKSILEDFDDTMRVEAAISNLCKVMNEDMQLSIKDKEIYRVLKKIPKTCEGNYSFPHFMFAMGNPDMAQAKGVFLLSEQKFSPKLDARYESEIKGKCHCWGDEDCKQERNAGDGKPGTGEAVNSEQEEEDEEDDEGTPSSRKPAPKLNANGEHPSNTPDETGYSLREKLFFSGLLIFEMYDTLKKVQDLYTSIKIPETADKEREKNKKRGYGLETLGIKKMKEAAWDKPLLPLPKLSPYLSAVPFVTSRWNTSSPGPHEKIKRTYSKLQQLHLAIRPPKRTRQPICITENQNRVRQALAYLASKGDCVACLPDIHFVIHLSDTAVNKLEVITVREPLEGCVFTTLGNVHLEGAEVMRDARTFFQPYILPKQITQLTNNITYTDGLQLRDICRHLQKQHWSNTSQGKLDFREKVWRAMHVDEVPFGRLRDGFIYSFVTYLPYVSHLPIIHQNHNPF